MPDLSGQTLGKYRLIERLGRGGMAEVYRAYQPSLDREVAIKVMHSYLADDDEFVGRFGREAKAIAALHHVHIVQVHDFDFEDDVYYMVMEYIRGETLKDRLGQLHQEGKRMDLEQVLEVFRALCDALDYAHSQGCIHRDIKPANIMFDGDRLVLTDFGIASIVGGTRFTATGGMVGTPAYMAPEQGQGEPGGIASDVYSVGVILYEVVTGSLPYDADTPLAIILKHLNEPLPIPSQICDDIPAAVERVILKALAKRPDDRYSSAGELSAALDAAATEPCAPAEKPPRKREAPAPQPTISGTPAAPGKRRVPWGLIAGAAVAVVALIAGIMFLPRLLGPEASPEADVHLEAGRAALDSWDLELAIAEFSDAIDRAPRSAEAYFWRGVAYYGDGELEDARRDLEQAIELDPGLVEAHTELGRLYLHEWEEWERAVEHFSTAIEIDPGFVDAYVGRAQCYLWYTEEYGRALADIERVIELDPQRGEGWMMRGEFHFWNEDYAQAVPDLLRGVELVPDDAWTWKVLGIAQFKVGDHEAALDSLNRAIDLDPADIEAFYHRAMTLGILGRFEEAISDLERVVTVQPENGGAQWALGRFYVEQGRLEEAIGQFESAVSSEEIFWDWVYFPEDDPRVDLALTHHAMGDSQPALEVLGSMVDQDPFWFLPRYWRGVVYRDMGLVDEAAEDFQVAIEEAPDEEWRRIAEEDLLALQNN